MSEKQITESYSLSPLQKGMLFHHLEAPNSGSYIQQVVVTLREPVHIPLLHQAWQQVTDRHSALRSSFHCRAAEPPLQRIDPSVSLSLQEQDWSGLAASEQEHRLSRLLTLDRQRGFDVTRAPLMRLALFRFGENDFRLVWTFHHILADGRSRLLLLQEAFARYQASKCGSPLDLPETRPYSEYIRWLEEQDFKRAEPFWRRHLEGYLAPAPLSFGRRDNHSLKRSRREAQEDSLSPAATAALKAFAAQNHITLNSLIQGAWAFLLSRYSGDSDVVFGATRACRKSTVADSESMIGLFINTVPVRIEIDAQDSVLDCVKALRAQWVSMREYEHTPLTKIHGWSSVPSGQPLFETIVVFENSHLAQLPHS